MMGGNGYGQGMMGGGMMGGYGPGGMMGYTQNYTGTNAYGCPGFGGGPGDSQGYGMMGMMGRGGMMGGGMMWNNNSPFFAVKPLTIAEATEAVNTYLANLNDSNLELHEIMIFDNHAYAEVVEIDTGVGAMELLIDPTTKTVYPEMGPNMMWNLKYGMMSGFGGYGMMGRMMGYPTPAEPSAELPVTPAEAIEAAQTYLDTYLPDSRLTVEEEAEPFYGYYTLHVSRDGETVGMLSVNGYTQQVFLHTWHGKLLEMSEE
jgi:hypothetical protein